MPDSVVCKHRKPLLEILLKTFDKFYSGVYKITKINWMQNKEFHDKKEQNTTKKYPS